MITIIEKDNLIIDNDGVLKDFLISTVETERMINKYIYQNLITYIS